jgi:hypothetical protein
VGAAVYQLRQKIHNLVTEVSKFTPTFRKMHNLFGEKNCRITLTWHFYTSYIIVRAPRRKLSWIKLDFNFFSQSQWKKWKWFLTNHFGETLILHFPAWYPTNFDICDCRCLRTARCSCYTSDGRLSYAEGRMTQQKILDRSPDIRNCF